MECDRCHRRFESYSGLSQHYEIKHHNAHRPLGLEKGLATEKELDAYRATVHYRHGPSRIKLIAFLLILIIAAGVVGYVALTPREQDGSKITIGAIAPDFTLANVNGGTFTLSSYRGKSNVLLFFSEGLSCQPCLAQMQGLDALNPEFGSLNILVVSITGDSLQTLGDWARSSGPRYGLVLSDLSLQVSRTYGMLGPDVSMMPGSAPGHSFVLVDKNGMTVWRHDYGPSNMSVPNDEILAAVKQALGD